MAFISDTLRAGGTDRRLPTTFLIKERIMYRTAIAQRVSRSGAGVALLFAAALAITPTITAAAEPVTRKVKIADLNLTSSQGQQTLARRLRVAVDQVCAPSAGENRLRISREKIGECRRCSRPEIQPALNRNRECGHSTDPHSDRPAEVRQSKSP